MQNHKFKIYLYAKNKCFILGNFTNFTSWHDVEDVKDMESEFLLMSEAEKESIVLHPYVGMRSMAFDFCYLDLSTDFKIEIYPYANIWMRDYSSSVECHNDKSIKNHKVMKKLETMFKTLKPEEIQLAKKYFEGK